MVVKSEASATLTQTQKNMNVDDSSVYKCSYLKQKASANLFKAFNRFAINHQIAARFMGIGVGVAYAIIGIGGRVGTTLETLGLGVGSLITRDGEAKRHWKNFGISLVKDVLLPFEVVGKTIGATVMIAKSPDVDTQNVFRNYHEDKAKVILHHQQDLDKQRVERWVKSAKYMKV